MIRLPDNTSYLDVSSTGVLHKPPFKVLSGVAVIDRLKVQIAVVAVSATAAAAAVLSPTLGLGKLPQHIVSVHDEDWWIRHALHMQCM